MNNGKIETASVVSAFVRRNEEIILATNVFIKHRELVKVLEEKYNKNWRTDIENNLEERKNWDMGLFLRGEKGEIKIGGCSSTFVFPEDSEMPIVRSATMKLLSEQYQEETFVEVTGEENNKLIEERIRILES